MQTLPISIPTFIAGIIACFVLHSAAIAQVRSHESIRVSPNAAVSQTIGTTEVTITYGRPSVRDRVIFGERVPFDDVWRTGANEGTTITFSKDVRIEGEDVGAGTYSVFSIPRQRGNWTIILNSDPEQWATRNYDQDKDVLRFDVSTEKAPSMEQMIFYFDEVNESTGKVVFHWHDVKFSFRIDEK